MITLYIEPNKIEEFALFEEEMPHWNKIIKSGIHLCLNISYQLVELQPAPSTPKKAASSSLVIFSKLMVDSLCNYFK